MLLLIARGRPIKNMRGLQLHPDNLFELLIKQSSAAAKREMDIEGDRASR